MQIEIAPVSEADYGDFVRAEHRAFGDHPRAEDIDVHRKIFEPGRVLAAYDGSSIVGTTVASTMELTVPGGTVPMAGVTGVGVAPTHRRRGILTQLMRRQLSDVRGAGEPVAGLWASESAIYGRFGYGMATLSAEIQIERGRTAFLAPIEDPGRVRLIEKEAAMGVLPGILDRVRLRTPGMWSRSQAWWETFLADLEHWRDGASALWFVIHETDGAPDGFATYRVKEDWSAGVSASTLKVRELFGETDTAYAALWRYCFDIDLIAKIESWPRPSDEPLWHMLADPRRLNMKLFDGLWIRLVDIPPALEQRRYQAEGSVVFEVRDEFCPWNQGRYQLKAGPDGAACRHTEEAPDLALSAADLGAAYLGGVRFSTLARAGRVRELHGGALGRADTMFSWDPQPWCPAVF